MGSLSFQSPFPRDQGHADVRPGRPSHLHTTQADLHTHHTVLLTVSRARAHVHTDMLSHDSHTRTSTVCPWFSLRLFAQTLPGPQRQVSPRELLPSAPSQVSGEQPQRPLASRPSPAAQGPQVSPPLREALGDGPGWGWQPAGMPAQPDAVILGPLETSLDWGPGGCVGEMGQARTWALPRGTQRAETGSKMGAKPLPS